MSCVLECIVCISCPLRCFASCWETMNVQCQKQLLRDIWQLCRCINEWTLILLCCVAASVMRELIVVEAVWLNGLKAFTSQVFLIITLVIILWNTWISQSASQYVSYLNPKHRDTVWKCNSMFMSFRKYSDPLTFASFWYVTTVFLN